MDFVGGVDGDAERVSNAPSPAPEEPSPPLLPHFVTNTPKPLNFCTRWLSESTT